MRRLSIALVLLVSVLLMGFKVVMVTDVGGLGDKSFNDGTWAGIQRAVKELKIEAKVVQSYEQSDYIPNLSKAAEEADLVFAVGFMMTDALFKVARQYPKTLFVGIDITPPEGQTFPNVLTFTFKEQECAFLVGYLAAAMTKTGTVGFVGGIPIPPVERFRYGFEAGVKTYNTIYRKNVKVLRGYTQDFEDPKKGKDLAMSQFNQGADIVFHASGACGNGVIEAAREKFSALTKSSNLVDFINYYLENNKGFFAIGVDMDQDYMAPGAVLASAMKRVDTASYLAVTWAYKGTFKGGHMVLGIAEDGVGISPMKYTKGIVPNRVIAELVYLEKLMKEGTLKVPETQEELNAFKVPTIRFPF